MSPTVLYIGGVGRSGSTLVDRMLGQVPGVCSVGELVFLWERGLQADERCGCGEPFRGCAFWAAVGDEAFGGWDHVDAEAILRLRRRVDRNRYVPLMLWPRLFPRYAARLQAYVAQLSRVYSAVATVSGARVIVDSSKHVSTAALLRRVPGVDLRVAHLVRDPRGVAFSWGKLVEKPEVADGEAYMARVGPARIGARWVGYNLGFDALRLGHRALLQRYETVVREPERELRRLLALTGRADADLSFLDGRSVTLGVNHTVAGNPLRFVTGKIEVRADEEWRGSMPARDRTLVTAITWPALARYGYLGSDAA